MKVYIVIPYMMIENDKIKSFNEEVKRQLEEYGVIHVVITNHNIAINRSRLVQGDLIIIYNEGTVPNNPNKEIVSFLEKATQLGVEIYPVALDKDKRVPRMIISDRQSYDVWEQLRCRDLDEKYIETIARIFSRKIIAKAFPTIYCESGEIFISHRRLDGEEMVAKIYDKMIVQVRETNPFRDVVNVKVGEVAQKVIDEEMKNSDIFVFFHTLEAAKSDWVIKELNFAVLRNIPILWIQIGDINVNELKIKPSDNPHLKYRIDELEDDKQLTLIVDEILHKAFGLIMERSNRIFGDIELLKDLFGENVTLHIPQEMIYKISMKRKGYHYPQRNIEQYYQVFGRTPTEDDVERLKTLVNGDDFDSIVILTNRVISSFTRQKVTIDSMRGFYDNWSKYIMDGKMTNTEKEIVISGAFPDANEMLKQNLTDALIHFSKAILQNGYKLTFGAHPTFQEIFYEVAKEVEPIHFKNKINMYISEFFLNDDIEKEKVYQEKYTLWRTEQGENLQLSLSEMRKKMIQRKEVIALVCLGGKIKSNKNEEGVREEIELARDSSIPVFIVGSVGGCSSVLASEYKNKNWQNLNEGGDDLNEEFWGGIDYFSMAQKMIRYLQTIV